MHQNGPQASPSGVSQGTPPSSFNSFGASHLPAFTRTAPQVPIPTSIAHERGIPIMAPAGYPSVLASGGGAQHPPIFSGSGSSGSLGSAGLGPFAHRVDSANQTMQTFESQIRWVAHQAAKLRTQCARSSTDARPACHACSATLTSRVCVCFVLRSARRSQHLRSDNRIDPNRVDGLLAMLRNATLGEEEQHRVGVVKPSAVHSSPPKSERAEDVRYDETRRGATGARRRNHRQDQTEILRQWFDDHAADPYPTPNEKAVLAKRVGMEVRQVEHWFTNHRKRHWLKQDQEGAQAGSATGSQDHCSGAGALLSMSGGRSGTCDVSMDDAE